jgi:hypothetical protein
MTYPRLDSRTRIFLRTIHIGATVSVLGADLALLALGLSGLAGADPLTIYPAAHLVAGRVIAPLALVSLGTGVLLAALTPWGLFRHLWITIKLGIVLLLTAAVLFVLVPGLSATAAQVVAPSTPAPGAVSRLPLVIAPAVASTLIGAALVLAILKPDWRRRGDSPRWIQPLLRVVAWAFASALLSGVPTAVHALEADAIRPPSGQIPGRIEIGPQQRVGTDLPRVPHVEPVIASILKIPITWSQRSCSSGSHC